MRENNLELKKILFNNLTLIILGLLFIFISLFTVVEIILPLVFLLLIYSSYKYNKRGIIYATLFSISLLLIQNLYILEVQPIELIIEIFIIITAALYIYNSSSSIEKLNSNLEERVKELSALNNISKITEEFYGSLDTILKKIASEIPQGYQHPEDLCVKINYQDKEYKTDNFKKTKWQQKTAITIDNEAVGRIEVCYLNKYSEEYDNSPFLKEEFNLLELFSDKISNIIKIAEQEKRAKEQRDFLSITLNSIGDGVIITDKNGRVTRLNKTAQKMTKWNQEEAKGSHISEIFKIINSKTGEMVKNPVKKVLTEGKTVDLANHTKLIARDNTEHHIADSAAPIKDKAGEIYGVVLVFRNVTEKYQMREEIKNKAELFSNAVTEAPFPIMLHNNKGEVLEVNDVWQELTGYSETEISTIDEWLEQAYDKSLNKEDLKEIYQNISEVSTGEFTIRTKEKQQRIWDIKNSYLGLDEQDNKLFISMAVDITENKQMDKKIKMFNRIYRTLSSVNQLIVNENSIDHLLKQAVEVVVDVGKYDTAWIAKVSDNKDLLDVKAIAGYNCSFLRERKVELNYQKDNLNIYKDAILNEETVILNFDTEQELKGENCGSTGVFVLKIFDEIWGLMVFCSNEENRFDNKEYALLKELTADVSLGIEKIISKQKQKESEAKLAKSEKEYRQLVQKSPIGIYKTSYSGKLLFVNPTIAKMLGFNTPEEVYDHYNEDLENKLYVDSNKRKKFIKQLQRYGEVKDFVYRIYDKNNEIKWIEDNARISSDKQLNDFTIEGFVLDITERKKHQEKIAYMSFHDSLTGLYNRSYLEDMMERIDTKRNLPICLIMADLNNLKQINDLYGHSTGDKWIKKAAEIIKNSCRQEDVIARWGGDEFVILLPHTKIKESEKIIARINESKIETDEGIEISIALGTACKNKREQDIFEVLNEAENRMYINKFADRESGRGIVLAGFLNTLKEKSFETENHVNRMGELSRRFGKKLDLSNEQIDKLFILSLLHDIGKISVPEKILTKAGKLSEEEWGIIKSHPEAGYRIIESIPRFSHIAEEILHHHERWDGRGYPDGLAGEEIPLLSRVLTIVDSYDVMTGGRPYKKAMSKKEAIEELKRCAGTQFDPELVKYFVDMISN
ncbi:HD domain-containing phosphohydrolase [Halanaerobium hydrogeniformans]|uniref:Diguanylate cyclase and metal dependent phosphohydrolase n=1 Tax=Halanaerobium hydrogeniformans TaxID=656519 RepID=E4RMH2_HALHG|nr:HD domain-containing phosphohydrolase [Halanaerobium hydrogeniformans]ADQ14503.1 diguanylate cyclase and metal dependent phosphohydrolase [Halanaerobium hydrogeniformans]